MHQTRREMIRLGLGSSALLACGATVPTFLARSAAALAGAPASAGKGRVLVLPARRRERRPEYGRPLPGRHLPPPPAEPPSRRQGGQAGGRPRRPPPPRSTASSSCWTTSASPSSRGSATSNPNRSHFESMTIWHTAPEPRRGHTGLAGTLTRPSRNARG
ncbi:MAG: hypothetical protein WKF75_16095 [Singulisphaera sp.]